MCGLQESDGTVFINPARYTYLGTGISSTGNFNTSLEHLKEKALHALFSLRKHTNFSKLKPSLACKIFETMISPILSYNSEIWGVYVKHDFKAWDNTPIEKTHLKFCKRYLEISNKASNVASRSELGRFPLIIISIYTLSDLGNSSNLIG